MFPQTLESWIYLAVACVMGILIGRWIRHRQSKPLDGAESTLRTYAQPRQRVSKKERRKKQRLSK